MSASFETLNDEQLSTKRSHKLSQSVVSLLRSIEARGTSRGACRSVLANAQLVNVTDAARGVPTYREVKVTSRAA